MVETKEYVLGADPEELARLRFQHTVWVEQQYAVLTRAGLRAGERTLDLGSGPGPTSFELARIVGETGHVLAVERSARFLTSLREERDRLGLTQVDTWEGDVEDLTLEPDSIDLAYARWLLCWPREPERIVAKVHEVLRPGGAFVIQDYLDWGAMKLVPRSPAFERGVAACMESWRQAGGTIDIGDRIPDLARDAGFQLETFEPIARTGRVGSLEWRWMATFFRAYLPKLVPQGLFSEQELAAWHADWNAREASDHTRCYTPTMLDIVLRKR